MRRKYIYKKILFDIKWYSYSPLKLWIYTFQAQMKKTKMRWNKSVLSEWVDKRRKCHLTDQRKNYRVITLFFTPENFWIDLKLKGKSTRHKKIMTQTNPEWIKERDVNFFGRETPYRTFIQGLTLNVRKNNKGYVIKKKICFPISFAYKRWNKNWISKDYNIIIIPIIFFSYYYR